tara:strand:+ start:279 stop:623 length:345 start_codon:yes stop_codon:yes gene_type:complete
MGKKGPCWDGYEMIGMKSKSGRKVPNCVPKKSKGGEVEKMLLGGLLTTGIRYAFRKYAKAGGRKLVDLTKKQTTGVVNKRNAAKSDLVEGIKMHGGSSLSKSDKFNLNYYKDIL